MADIGGSVVQGSRNGYGDFCVAKPSIMVGVNEGGALTEAWGLSGGHTTTIYRDTSIYLDAPPGIDQATPDEGIAMANAYWPQLKARFDLNPADYYIVLNEPAGNSVAVMPTYIAYETRCMILAENDNLKLCVLNLATGTPDDGSVSGGDPNGGMEVWKQMYVPHIQRAYAGGHIYGRHAYEKDYVVPVRGMIQRIFAELNYLRSVDWNGGLAITEIGFNDGYGYVGNDQFVSQVRQFEAIIRGDKNIVGPCWWTLGDWNDANWQTAIPDLTTYMIANPSDPWTPPENGGSVPPETKEQYLWRLGVQEQETCGIRLNDEAALEAAIKSEGRIPVISEITAIYPGDPNASTIQAGEDLQHVLPRKTYVYEPGKPIHSFTEPNTPLPPLTLQVWPTDYHYITQYFGENPQNYDHYCDAHGVCLKGHNGWDLMAPMGTRFKAAVAGVVTWASDQRPSGGPSDYGWHVRIQTGDYLIIYAHMSSNIQVEVGDQVLAGKVIGYSGNTGRSTGPHLHFEMRKCPGLPGWPWCIIDCTPYIEPLYDPNPSANIDMLPYWQAVPQGYGPFYVLQHDNGITENVQCQVFAGEIYLVKNQNYEHLRVTASHVERREDTSMSDELMYTLDDGNGWSRWSPRYWKPGDIFKREPKVTVMRKDNCAVISQNVSTTWLLFVALHEHWTSPPSNASPNGIEFNDVIELAYNNTDNVLNGWLEKYWLAKDIGGYVEWMNNYASHSWISELPQGRPPLQREIIHCL